MANPGLAGELLSEIVDRHLLVNYSLNASSVLRFTPPAVMTDDDTAFLLAAFDDACAAVGARFPHNYIAGAN
jgi:putrescine aminotransferase